MESSKTAPGALEGARLGGGRAAPRLGPSSARLLVAVASLAVRKVLAG